MISDTMSPNQYNSNPVPKYSEKNRCSGYNNFNEYHLFFSEYSGAGLKNTRLGIIILTLVYPIKH